MAVFAPAPEASKTCRGKAGKSKPHPHYTGLTVVYVSGYGYVTRCTSCGAVVSRANAAGLQPVDVTPEFALAFMNAAL